ncbi:MAG: HEAT repeat domain-containing protein, partial [Waterburya sp.]
FPQEFLENPILDCLFLENSDFLHNIPTDVFNQLFKQKGYTEYLQQLASNSKQWQVRSAMAENLHTSIDILQKLAADPHQGVRLAVARNPNASIDALKQLAANFNPGVRRTVARNPNVSRDILEILAADPHQDVRSVVANNLKYQAKKLKSN